MINIPKPYVEWLLHYDRTNAKFYWKNHWYFPRFKALQGKEAGYIQPDGYLGIRIGRKHYPLHKLVWLMETGSLPTKMIDHINGDKLNNHISNLREVNNRRNQQNQKRHRAGHLVGATLIKRTGRWQSQIQADGKHHSLGYFDTELEAHQRYVQELKVRALSLPRSEMQEFNILIKQDLGEV